MPSPGHPPQPVRSTTITPYFASARLPAKMGRTGILNLASDPRISRTDGSRMSAMLFLMAVLAGLFFVPALAALVRSQVPVRRGASPAVEAITFGTSQKARRSPRHAVLLHRGLMGSFFMALVALSIVPAAVSLSALGTAAIPAALAFALPTLLVTLHARRRSSNE